VSDVQACAYQEERPLLRAAHQPDEGQAQVTRKPFILEAMVFAAFVGGLVLARVPFGCAGTPPIVSDVISIEAKDAACIAENFGEPDAVIVANCSPAGDTQKQEAIQVVLNICHQDSAAVQAVVGDASRE
jgi:hypothetical protein